jgi:uncharacterized membrane protein
MFDTFNGLPVHPLVVHATVALLPAAALAVALAALWPRFRRWAGPAPLLLALGAMVLVPVTLQSGETLQRRIGGGGELVQAHADLGRAVVPWAVGLVLVAAALGWVWWRERRGPGRTALPRGAVVGLDFVALVAAGGTTVTTAQAGHSGATAVWSGIGNLPAPE